LAEAPEGQAAPGDFIRTYFRVLDDWVDESELDFQRYSIENPVGFMVRLENNGHLSGEQNLGLVERYTVSMHADFGDNNGVIEAYEAVHEVDNPTPEASKVLDDAIARAQVKAMQDLPAVTQMTFVPFTYISAWRHRATRAPPCAMLNTHVHFHVCVVGGVFEAVTGPIAQSVDAVAQANPAPQNVILHAATSLDESAIATVQADVHKRILRAFVARGHIEACDAKDINESAACSSHGGGFSVDAGVPY
jgi:hypothetical protein